MSKEKMTNFQYGQCSRCGHVLTAGHICALPGLELQKEIDKLAPNVYAKPEAVDHPQHYGGDTLYETIKVLEAWLTHDEFVGFLKGNVIKYLSRAEKKNGIEDYKKATWYQNYLTEHLKRLCE